MTPADLDLAAALRALLRHPLVRDELRAIAAEATPGAAAPEGFISVSEAARRWGVAQDTVRDSIVRGRLPASKPGGCKAWRIRPSDLEAFLAGESREVTPHPPTDLAEHRAVRARRLADAVKGKGQ